MKVEGAVKYVISLTIDSCRPSAIAHSSDIVTICQASSDAKCQLCYDDVYLVNVAYLVLFSTYDR